MITSKHAWMVKLREVMEDFGESAYVLSGLTDFLCFLDFLRELLDHTCQVLSRRDTYAQSVRQRTKYEPAKMIFGNTTRDSDEELFVIKYRDRMVKLKLNEDD